MRLKFSDILGSTALALACLAVTACAPKPQKIQRPTATIDAGPRLDDVDLKLESRPSFEPKIEWDGEVPAAAVFRFAEDLINLRGGLSEEAHDSWTRRILDVVPHENAKISASAYAELLIDQSEPLAQETLADVLPGLQKAPKVIRQALAKQGAPVGPNEIAPLGEVVGRMYDFLSTFEASVPKIGIPKAMHAPLRAELKEQIARRQEAEEAIRYLSSARTLKKALTAVVELSEQFGFTLHKPEREKMEEGRRMGNAIESYQDVEGALAVLIDIWIYLSPEERETIFKAASPDLYDYLLGMSHGQLECLKNKSCFSIPQWLAKSLVIKPQIMQYGLENLRVKLNESGADAVRANVEEVLSREMRELPDMVADRVEQSIKKRIAPIEKLQSDFKSEFKGRVDRWAARTIEKEGPSIYRMQPSKARLRVGSQGRVRLDWTETASIGQENAGAFSSLAATLWQEDRVKDARQRAVVLSEISSLAKKYLQMKTARKSKNTFKAESDSAIGYAESIRGLSRVTRALRDWEKGPIDELLSGHKAKDLFPEFPLPELDQELFPKDAFFALGFNSVSELLKRIESDKSQLFVLDTDKKVHWLSEGLPKDATTVMAGIVDRSGDKLATLVRAEDVARTILALAEFLDAAKDIEKSKSEFLLRPYGEDKKIPRDEIIAARDSIRMLILGLANYLSHQFRPDGGLIVPCLEMKTQKPCDSKLTVSDQSVGIRALIVASEALGSEIYSWEAADVLTSMNGKLYREDLGFYGLKGEKSVSPLVLVETLHAFQKIERYLTPASRVQIEKLSAPWREKIGAWKLSGE